MMNDKRSSQIPTQNDDSKIVIDFGSRKILCQNFSRLVTLPKTALLNWNKQEAKFVNITLVYEKGQRYIKLTPIHSTELE